MLDAIKAAVDWAREQDVSPWSAIWLIVGYLSLRLLAMLGSGLSYTAKGVFSHYNGVISSLEKRLETQRHELDSAKAEIRERNHEIANLNNSNMLLRERLEVLNDQRRTRSKDHDANN